MWGGKVKTLMATALLAGPGALIAGEGVERIVFPPPPDKARIEYVSSFAQAKDVREKEPGFFKKFAKALFGKDQYEGVLMQRPFGVAAFQGRIYASDNMAASVVVFDPANQEVSSIGQDSVNTALNRAMGMTVDAEGNVYVADPGSVRVMVYRPDGSLKLALGGKGDGPGEMGRPLDVAVHPGKKQILVTDGIRSLVNAYDMNGKFQYAIGSKGSGSGQFSVPVGITVDKDGRILVTDTILCRITIFDENGKFLDRFGECGDTIGFFGHPKGVASDSQGNIYVADGLFSVVQVFNREGKLLMHFGREGNLPGTFDIPSDLYIDAQDKIYVADSMNRRVQVFRLLKEDDGGKSEMEEKE